MNKNTYVVGAIIGSLMCSMAWAGIPGTYHCESSHHGKQHKGDIVVHKMGDKYTFDMRMVGKDKKMHGTLMSTKDSKRFINSWKCNKGVGMSTWTFADKSLMIDSTHLRKNSKDKMRKMTHCTKK